METMVKVEKMNQLIGKLEELNLDVEFSVALWNEDLKSLNDFDDIWVAVSEMVRSQMVSKADIINDIIKEVKRN